MAYDDLLNSLAFALVPVVVFGLLLCGGVALDLWADFVAVRKSTRGRPWLVYRRRLRVSATEKQRN